MFAHIKYVVVVVFWGLEFLFCFVFIWFTFYFTLQPTHLRLDNYLFIYVYLFMRASAQLSSAQLDSIALCACWAIKTFIDNF